MYNESRNKYKNSNVTLIEDNEDIAKIDITTSKGHMFRDKALMIADDQHGGDFTALVSNLTDIEKENLFNALDASLHNNTDTNAYMIDKIMNLEGQIDNLTELVENNTEDNTFASKYDFYEE
ncbi:hypothetical protein [Clostridium tagluense]|uniref:hypothetical protein n=1 Tax=Clostridium tagluense TaxID=360422 RepID=UPI001C6DF504|nr:hypothetical protein [Clostridium tagluense]MBW9155936.1 hypothetical protein [Clostridium tagluense]WLC63984.1 hypothetical protein KTC93_13980 [Clostridium tagluense]